MFLKGGCPRGLQCPYKHIKSEKSVVCKHWLRGLCKKEDQCEFLHEYNLKKMPECWFYSRYGECASGEECIYLHIDPETKIPECPWYNRGFCKHGPNCKSKHVRRLPCILFLAGFCPKGHECENGHPKFEIPTMDKDRNQNRDEKNFNSFHRNPNYEGREWNQQHQFPHYPRQHNNFQNPRQFNNRDSGLDMKRLEEVTCYKVFIDSKLF
ncbi:Cleavage and polyadenylation specificity factor subunit 4 [Entomophthora muscae]|uniref:Cleavage and polyadenylation specificity factor subunit 4 n=1 Tax=Entomophthora muscae TaxID=34485 RepID=A0ACC2U1F3_9FUNG|nr:Cleavage and polyadenylation specificity factor subunit 4 [Entomophthora muscae]